MPKLPDNLNHYKTTPEFTEQTVPAGLLKDHNTRAGVWGKIVVLEGALEYCVVGAQKSPCLLTPEKPGIVEPEVSHCIKPQGKVRFHVEFYKK